MDRTAVHASLNDLRTANAGEHFLGWSTVLEEVLGSTLLRSGVRADAEDVVLVIGPPRSGKTTGILIPNILLHDGAAVVTSTKPDVFEATRLCRSQLGQVHVFDPTGSVEAPPWAGRVNWDPVCSATDWNSARSVARDIVFAASRVGSVKNEDFWNGRAASLIAPLILWAHLNGASMDWVAASLESPQLLQFASQLELLGYVHASQSLRSVCGTVSETRSSIVSTAANALEPWNGDRPPMDPEVFDINAFVCSSDTIYLIGSGFDHGPVAPAITAFVGALARATYASWRRGHRRVLFALDEVANIAPLPNLPALMAEGGGQGVKLLLALQDLSQARGRWPAHATGFLTLARHVVLLPGVRDTETLSTLARLCSPTGFFTLGSTNEPSAGIGMTPADLSALDFSMKGERYRAFALGREGWRLLSLPRAYNAQAFVAELQCPGGDGRHI